GQRDLVVGADRDDAGDEDFEHRRVPAGGQFEQRGLRIRGDRLTEQADGLFNVEGLFGRSAWCFRDGHESPRLDEARRASVNESASPAPGLARDGRASGMWSPAKATGRRFAGRVILAE